ncbi:hypothetical protein GY45DRAFT_1320715 [Cubamyces sp. BRFM 1775]|nr:hypothetical protein GY45DRAFT_1320715 [Cubamyces sp. BRFM 1775]
MAARADRARHLRDLIPCSSVTIQSTEDVRWSELQACYHVLATRFPVSLRKVIVRIRHLSDDRENLPVALVQLVSPLHKLQQLEVFCISIDANPGANQQAITTPTTEEVAALVSSWPQVRVLRIRYQPGCTPGCSIDTLATIAKHCPGLETLHLRPLNIEGAARCDVSSLPALDHKLRSLSLAGSDPEELCGELGHAAEALDKLFPHADLHVYMPPSASPGTSPSYAEGWLRFGEYVMQVSITKTR